MSSPEFNRRHFVIGALTVGAASLANPINADAEEFPNDINKIKNAFVDKALKELRENPEVLAHVSTNEFWAIFDKDKDGKRIPRPGNVPDLKAQLLEECYMYIPGVREIADLKSRCGPPLTTFLAKLTEGEFALIADGEYDRTTKKMQTKYLACKRNGQVEFVMAVPMSASMKEWSNVKNSNGSPIGEYVVERTKVGVFGQIVSNAVENPDLYEHLPVKRGGKTSYEYFPKSIYFGDKFAVITTAVLWIVEERNIGSHGSNKIAGIGYPGSDGCFRASNMAELYLAQFLKKGSRVFTHTKPWTDEQRIISKAFSGFRF